MSLTPSRLLLKASYAARSFGTVGKKVVVANRYLVPVNNCSACLGREIQLTATSLVVGSSLFAWKASPCWSEKMCCRKTVDPGNPGSMVDFQPPLCRPDRW